ncbi:MAG: response regulator [Acidobacteria bacterium]|nr:response regulator [Acidobacteriota bacterium]
MAAPRRILIAEDDAASRELLAEILSNLGYEVVEACDGGEALQKIEETAPDLILLDIQMPVLDGFAVVRRLREHPRFCSRPVVAVTAYAMQGDREQTLQAGFNGYLSKPVDAAVLRVEIERHLRMGVSGG